MSFAKDLKELGLPEAEVKRILEKQNALVRKLKLEKRILERLIRSRTKSGRFNGRWKSKTRLAEVAQLQQQRTKINAKIFRHSGSKKKNPEFDSDP